MLHVTEENMIGITDIDINVINMLLSGVSAFPMSGKHIPINIAHTAHITVEYPLFKILKNLSIFFTFSP